MKDKQHYKALGKKSRRAMKTGTEWRKLQESVKNIRKQKVSKREKTRPTIEL